MTTRPPSWIGRNHISIFVHSLHFLDLDLLEDWPEVTIDTFDSKSDLQHRLRCVEWSLYRLFELYDRRSTKDKLLPFFPPVTSLQSMNLRAALFRQLTELKKNGGLGQNVVLRKTMLDECKGEKFEEMIATFSIVVLRKTRGTAGIGFDPLTVPTSQVVPLIISHRRGIQRDLEKRKNLQLRVERQKRALRAATESLTIEHEELERKKLPKFPENADDLRKMVRENWMGDNGWVEAIIHGIPPTETRKRQGTHDLASLEDQSGEQNASVLLLDLASRVQAQSVRLAQWQSCLQDLQQRRQPEVVQNAAKSPAKSSRISMFSQHQTLDVETEHEAELEFGLEARHASLITSLERELAKPKQSLQLANLRNQGTESLRKESLYRSKPARTAMPVIGPSWHRDHWQTNEAMDKVPGLKNALQQWNAQQDDTESEIKPTTIAQESEERTGLGTPVEPTTIGLSLTERTRASMAYHATPQPRIQQSKKLAPSGNDVLNYMATASTPKTQLDGGSLLERTRQSMSLLTSATGNNPQSQRKTKMSRPSHLKSKSMNLPAQRRKLERAWSEESLESVASKEDFDTEADYQSVFMSRPKLAMSPNMSPQRNDLFDSFLEESMKKLSIGPTAN